MRQWPLQGFLALPELKVSRRESNRGSKPVWLLGPIELLRGLLRGLSGVFLPKEVPEGGGGVPKTGVSGAFDEAQVVCAGCISSKNKGAGIEPQKSSRNFVSETVDFECRFPYDSYGRDRAPFWPFLGEGFWGNIRRPLVLPAPLFYCWYNHWETKGRFRKRVVLANVLSFPVFVPGEHANAPSFRFSFRGISTKTTLLENHPLCQPPIF